MSLARYNEKRNFKITPEPEGKISKKKQFRFVVQRHEATRLHYDFRLELDGTLKSWAVPKGPSLNPADKRLAMMVEDHPVSYIDFEGTIPEGNYGAGTVMVWDKGYFKPVNEKHEEISEKQAITNLGAGQLKFEIHGEKLNGEFVLIRLKTDKKGNSWLLIKHRDEYAVDHYNSEDDIRKTNSKKPKLAKEKKSTIKTANSKSPEKLRSNKKPPEIRLAANVKKI